MILIGDIHGKFHDLIYQLEHGGREINYIQVGDFGLGFSSEEYDNRILDRLDELMIEKDCHFFVIRGNHDNPEFWNRENSYQRVHLVRDNELLEIEGQQVFFLGGGISVDRLSRKLGESFWIDELVDADFKRIDEIEHVDIVVSHIAPGGGVWPREYNYIVEYFAGIEARYNRDLIADLDLERSLMTEVKERLLKKGVKQWFYGHYHSDVEEAIEGVTYTCVDINSFYEYKIDG